MLNIGNSTRLCISLWALSLYYSFVKNECWLDYDYDKPLESDDEVNHFTKCNEEYINWAGIIKYITKRGPVV